MWRPNQNPSSDLLHRIIDNAGSDRTAPPQEATAERARVQRERVRRMLVRSLFAGSVR